MMRSFNHENDIAFFGQTSAAIGRRSNEEGALEIAQNLSTVFAARANEWRSRGGAPKIVLKLMAKSGLLVISIPAESGGIEACRDHDTARP